MGSRAAGEYYFINRMYVLSDPCRTDQRGADEIFIFRSLTTITFGDGQSGATLSVDMTDADISGKNIGAGGAMIAAEFMQRMT